VNPDQERKLDRVLEGVAAQGARLEGLTVACTAHFEKDERQFGVLGQGQRELGERVARVETSAQQRAADRTAAGWRKGRIVSAIGVGVAVLSALLSAIVMLLNT